MKLRKVIPALRIFDEAKAREFYLDFLGFKVDFEHRFGQNFPLFMQVSRDECILHLSEHHGGASPGAGIVIQIEGIRDLHAELTAKNYRFAHPGLETKQWGALEMTVVDPFANNLTFSEKQAAAR